MATCLPFSKHKKPPDMKLKSSEENNNNFQVESSVEDHRHSKLISPEMKFSSKLQSQSSFDFNNKEEMYFDAYDQAWLESDAEDFQSVASDSTPMDTGTTPLQVDNSRKSFQSDVLAATETSSADAKKQLIELFCDSFTNDAGENKDMREPTTMTTSNPTVSYLSPKCRKTTAMKQSNRTKPKSPQKICCLPNLVRSLSSCSSERKKKK